MTRPLSVFIFCLGSHFLLQAQSEAERDTAYQSFLATYEQRITKDHLDGHYIPIDVSDAVTVLDELVADRSKEKIKVLAEEDLVKKLFFGFGRWLRVNWGFDSGSRLSHHLKGMGITHPEDMTKAMMIFYHRHLRGRDLAQKALATQLAEAREKLRLARLVPIDSSQQN